MLYQISVEVESEAVCQRPYKLEFDDHLIIEVLVNSDKVVEKLNLSLRIQNYQNLLPEISANIDTQTTQIRLRDSFPLSFLVNLAHHIEAFGSFWFGIKKIHWENPIRSWIAETPEEQADIEPFPNDFKYESRENKCYREMTPQMLTALVQNRITHQHLILPMSFYREGCNDFDSRRYTSSFINFYFYLDDLYGQGKTKNKEVEKLLKSSEHVRQAIEQTMQLYLEQEGIDNLGELKKFLEEEKKEFNINGIIELIIQVRGNLSHFSQKSSKKKGHPLNQREFRSIAYLMKSICTYTFIQLTTGEMPR